MPGAASRAPTPRDGRFSWAPADAVVDASHPLDDIIADHLTIEAELQAFNESLLERRKLVVLNKVDLLTDPEQIEKIRLVFAEKGISVLAISALAGSGIDELKQYLAETLAKGFDE